MDDARKENKRSNDFRYVYANGLATAFTGSEAMIVFGIKENPGDSSQVMREEVAVMMSLLTAKTLALTLTRILEDLEKKTGQNVTIDQAVRDRLEKILANAVVSPSPTS